MNSEIESIQEFETVFFKLKEMLHLTDDIMIRFYTTFFNTVAVTLSTLKEAVELEDYDAITLHAHSIKGSASSLCYDAISSLAKTIEEKAKVKESGDYTQLVSELAAQFETAQHNYALWTRKKS